MKRLLPLTITTALFLTSCKSDKIITTQQTKIDNLTTDVATQNSVILAQIEKIDSLKALLKREDSEQEKKIKKLTDSLQIIAKQGQKYQDSLALLQNRQQDSLHLLQRKVIRLSNPAPLKVATHAETQAVHSEQPHRRPSLTEPPAHRRL